MCQMKSVSKTSHHHVPFPQDMKFPAFLPDAGPALSNCNALFYFVSGGEKASLVEDEDENEKEELMEQVSKMVAILIIC